ncbi:MAG: hypothetical protein RIS45_550 [Planctomycetota bacterium]
MRRKKILIALTTTLALIALLVILAPTLLSGYVRGVIEQETAKLVNGTVAVRSVDLGWFGGQKVEGFAIDGGPEAGRIEMSAEVREGLLALVRGSDISLRLTGSSQTSLDAEGRLGLAKLGRPAAEGGASSTAGPGETPLGTRRLTVTLEGIDFSAKGPDGAEYALNDLGGEIVLAGTALTVGLDGSTRAHGKDGELSIDVDAKLAFGATGGADLAATTGTVKLGASGVVWPTAAGDLDFSTLKLDVAKGGAGDLAVKADLVTRVAGSREATVRADITVASPFDASGKFVLDPADIAATVEARGVPLGVFQPFVRPLGGGVVPDLRRDVGETADLSVVKQQGDRARVNLVTKQVQFAFDGKVAPDGTSIDEGTVTSRAAVQPELLRALGLGETGVLELLVSGQGISWRKSDDDFTRAIGGALELSLAQPFAFEAPGFPSRVRAESMALTVEKKLGEPAAGAALSLKGRYGATGDTELSARGQLDLVSRALTSGSLDATARIDSATIERMTNGAVSSRGSGASAKISVSELAYIPSDEFSGLRALVARARLEMSGAIAVEGSGTAAAVNDLSVEVSTPRGSTQGTLAVGAKVDGAELRVEQRFGPIPSDKIDLLALSPNGTVAISGLDPSFISRIAPDAARSVGLLGRGAMRLDARNRTDGGAIVADFTLDAAAIDAGGSVRYEPDSIAASNLSLDALLNSEAIASLDLGEQVELEPGVRISLRAPVLALARKDGAWAPSGDVAARALVENLRVRRAPGILAPLAISRIDASVSYAFADSRATASGKATLGASGSDGDLDFRIGWAKSDVPRLFGGASGTLELARFDLARFEPMLGLEPGAYSGVLGGAGSLRVSFSEDGAPTGTFMLDFPRTRGTLNLSAPGDASGRVARLAGSISADIAPETFAKVAGFARDATKRVTQPVVVELSIASAALPLDAEMKPRLAEASLDVGGSLSAVVIETRDAAGKPITLSTGALTLTAKSARLADEIACKIAAKDAAAAAAALEVDARVRGAVAANAETKANPVVDATVRATKFPAAAIDALAGTGGAVGRYLGDAIDAQVDAKALSASGGTLAANLSSEFATVDAPALTVSDGLLTVKGDKPVKATFSLSPPVREQLLSSIHPIFSDVTTGAPARFALTELTWPLDGDRKRLDGAFSLETGEMTLVNSPLLGAMLAVAGTGQTGGVSAFLDPLNVRVSKGRLTYRDFTLKVGKTAQGGWRNSLVFAGDIDLAAKPIRANSISTAIPLSDLGNWSRDARGLFESIGAGNPELLKRLTVGVEMKGPLFDPSGKPVKPEPKFKWPEVGDVLRDDPGTIIDAVGDIADIFKDKPKKPKKKQQPEQQGQPQQP